MKPPPNNFAEVAQGLSVRALCERFGVGERTITRWRRECGVTGKAARVSDGDTPEQIRACLNCPFPDDCRGTNRGCPLKR